jgi:hypothetical protein
MTHVMKVITETIASINHFLLGFQFIGLSLSWSPSQPTSLEVGCSSAFSAMINDLFGEGVIGDLSSSSIEIGVARVVPGLYRRLRLLGIVSQSG